MCLVNSGFISTRNGRGGYPFLSKLKIREVCEGEFDIIEFSSNALGVSLLFSDHRNGRWKLGNDCVMAEKVDLVSFNIFDYSVRVSES